MNDEREPAASGALQKSFNKKQILCSFIVIIAVLALALGIGLGVGLRNKLNASESQSNPGPPQQPNSSNTSSPTPGTSILPDTSVGALVTSGLNRRVFFQDTSGDLRHIVFDNNKSSWSSTAEVFLTNPSPRAKTPIAVLDVFDTAEEIHVFYIDNQNLPRATSSSQGLNNLVNDSFPVAPDSRMLSVSPLISTQMNISIEAALFYEAPSGGIVALHGYYSHESANANLGWNWQNVTGTLDKLLDSHSLNVDLGAPFGSSSWSAPNNTTSMAPDRTTQLAALSNITSANASFSGVLSWSFGWLETGKLLAHLCCALFLDIPLTSI